ncbi:MAG: MBL fold metallo-hydrolase [Bacteroidota bacterium]
MQYSLYPLFPKLTFFCACILLLTCCTNSKQETPIETKTEEVKDEALLYQSDDLIIRALTPNTYLHVTFLETQDYGKVGCNGLIHFSDGEAVIFDTPPTDSVSLELINWLEQKKQVKVKAIVPTHFHDDCLGGLKAFHDLNITSYANQHTIALATNTEAIVPQEGFEGEMTLSIGQSKVICKFLGEGHTRDNIVAYIPSDKVLFGGCLVKSLKAGKGYLATPTPPLGQPPHWMSKQHSLMPKSSYQAMVEPVI